MPHPLDPPQQPSVEQIDALLPQTQCRQCTFDGCRPYAEAIAAGSADINRCPPGGVEGISALARLTGKSFKLFAIDAPQPKPRALAVIDEDNCIGCTLCIQACPVDAILGAAKLMHTVIVSECTGCDLCIAPCPVDAIHMQPLAEPREHSEEERARARARHQYRQLRLARERDEKARRHAERRSAPPTSSTNSAAAPGANTLDEQKKAVIAAAMRRAAEKHAARQAPEEPK